MQINQIKYSRELLLYLKEKRVLTAFLKNTASYFNSEEVGVIKTSHITTVKRDGLSDLWWAFNWENSPEGHTYWKDLALVDTSFHLPLPFDMLTIKEFRDGR